MSVIHRPAVTAAVTADVSAAVGTVATNRRGQARWHARLLAVDAAGCGVIGIVVLAASEHLATALALSARGPVLLVGALFLLAGAVNGLAARRGSWWTTLAAVDLDLGAIALFAAVSAAADAATGWARLLLVAGAVISAVFATLKLVGAPSRHA